MDHSAAPLARTLVVLTLIAAASPAAANDLLARHASLARALEGSPFGMPIHVESRERGHANEGDRVWTFELRKDVRFQDGSAFDADTVIRNMAAFREAPFTFTKLHTILDRVEKLGDHTVRFHLDEPWITLDPLNGSSQSDSGSMPCDQLLHVLPGSPADHSPHWPVVDAQ